MSVVAEEAVAWIVGVVEEVEEVACIPPIIPVALVSMIREMDHESTVNHFKYVICFAPFELHIMSQIINNS